MSEGVIFEKYYLLGVVHLSIHQYHSEEINRF